MIWRGRYIANGHTDAAGGNGARAAAYGEIRGCRRITCVITKTSVSKLEGIFFGRFLQGLSCGESHLAANIYPSNLHTPRPNFHGGTHRNMVFFESPSAN